jgi:Arc/MetJ-type ribon-helix-helix transcriptional regulator
MRGTRVAPADDSAQIALRLPASLLAEAERLRTIVAPAGVVASRSDVIRAALTEGLKRLSDKYEPRKRKAPK